MERLESRLPSRCSAITDGSRGTGWRRFRRGKWIKLHEGRKRRKNYLAASGSKVWLDKAGEKREKKEKAEGCSEGVSRLDVKFPGQLTEARTEVEAFCWRSEWDETWESDRSRGFRTSKWDANRRGRCRCWKPL
jgi:hypothetical protein